MKGSTLTPEEFSQKVDESTEYSRLQVILLQRIAGYVHIIEWAVCLCALFLFALVLKR